jgi:hypothetical protein
MVHPSSSRRRSAEAAARVERSPTRSSGTGRRTENRIVVESLYACANRTPKGWPTATTSSVRRAAGWGPEEPVQGPAQLIVADADVGVGGEAIEALTPEPPGAEDHYAREGEAL